MDTHTTPGLYLRGGDAAGYVLEDGSRLEVERHGRTAEGRAVYWWTVRVAGSVLERGYDLHTGVNMDHGPVAMLASLCAFLGATAEHYRATMAPCAEGCPDYPQGFSGATQEWAYQHDDEVAMIASEVDEDA